MFRTFPRSRCDLSISRCPALARDPCAELSICGCSVFHETSWQNRSSKRCLRFTLSTVQDSGSCNGSALARGVTSCVQSPRQLLRNFRMPCLHPGKAIGPTSPECRLTGAEGASQPQPAEHEGHCGGGSNRVALILRDAHQLTKTAPQIITVIFREPADHGKKHAQDACGLPSGEMDKEQPC